MSLLTNRLLEGDKAGVGSSDAGQLCFVGLSMIENLPREWPIISGSTWVQPQKRENELCFQGKPFNITVIEDYAPTSNAEEADIEWFYEDLQDLLELTPKKDVLFIIGDWNAKVESQEIPGVTGKFGLKYKMKQGKVWQSFAKRMH